MPVRWLVLLVVLAACEGGQRIQHWTLADGTPVELPASLILDVPLTSREIDLHADVILDSDLRDRVNGTPFALTASGPWKQSNTMVIG